MYTRPTCMSLCHLWYPSSYSFISSLNRLKIANRFEYICERGMGWLPVGCLGCQLHGKVFCDASKTTNFFKWLHHPKLQLGAVWYYNLLPAPLLAHVIREGVVHPSFVHQICGKNKPTLYVTKREHNLTILWFGVHLIKGHLLLVGNRIYFPYQSITRQGQGGIVGFWCIIYVPSTDAMQHCTIHQVIAEVSTPILHHQRWWWEGVYLQWYTRIYTKKPAMTRQSTILHVRALGKHRFAQSVLEAFSIWGILIVQ